MRPAGSSHRRALKGSRKTYGLPRTSSSQPSAKRGLHLLPNRRLRTHGARRHLLPPASADRIDGLPGTSSSQSSANRSLQLLLPKAGFTQTTPAGSSHRRVLSFGVPPALWRSLLKNQFYSAGCPLSAPSERSETRSLEWIGLISYQRRAKALRSSRPIREF